MKRFFLMFLAVLIVLATVPQASYAHIGVSGDSSSRKADADTIIIKGVVKSISGNIWVVGDTPVEVNAGTSITGYPVIGSTVTIIVKRGDGDHLIAVTITLIISEGSPTATSTATSTAASTEESDKITICHRPPGNPENGQTITISRNAWKADGSGNGGHGPGRHGGDTEGPCPAATGTATATATATSSATPQGTEFPWTIIIIEGPVTEIIINIDTIIVYGMHIKLKHGDPILKKLKIGDWVRLRGHWDHDENNQLIIIVIIIVIIETPIIILPPSGGGNGHHDDD